MAAATSPLASSKPEDDKLPLDHLCTAFPRNDCQLHGPPSAFAHRKEFISPEFHWSDANYGLITAVFSIVYAVANLLAGRFIDWMGTKKGYLGQSAYGQPAPASTQPAASPPKPHSVFMTPPAL